jgi:two-component system OmpR family sensor kinase/two-component system sensor histidine kinase BaeS
MRLWVQLAAAFILLVLAVVLAATLLAQAQVTSHVRQYAQQERQVTLAADLAAYYARTGSWAGVASLVQQTGAGGRGPGAGRGRQMGRPLLVLTDPVGRVIASSQGDSAAVPPDALTIPIEVGGRVVGVLHSTPAGHADTEELSLGMEQMLTAVTRSLWLAGTLATAAGMLLSVLLARRIAAPLAEMARAAHRIAAGELAQQVQPSGSREVDEVAAAFNQMSTSLQQAKQARRNLLADVAHELRTPISVLQGNLRAMLDEVYPLSRGEIATLYDEILLLNRLVTDVRDLAQAEVGQLWVALQSTDLAALATRMAGLFADVGAAQEVTVQAMGPDTLPPVQADPARMQQVLSNLLTNALRHTPAGGTITVEVSAQDDSVMVAVRDTGSGIPPDDLPHVFERYWRASPGNGHSSGLGLAIARQLVLAQGGQMGVESTPGSGSRFWFTLPTLSTTTAAHLPE